MKIIKESPKLMVIKDSLSMILGLLVGIVFFIAGIGVLVYGITSGTLKFDGKLLIPVIFIPLGLLAIFLSVTVTLDKSNKKIIETRKGIVINIKKEYDFKQVKEVLLKKEKVTSGRSRRENVWNILVIFKDNKKIILSHTKAESLGGDKVTTYVFTTSKKIADFLNVPLVGGPAALLNVSSE